MVVCLPKLLLTIQTLLQSCCQPGSQGEGEWKQSLSEEEALLKSFGRERLLPLSCLPMPIPPKLGVAVVVSQILQAWVSSKLFLSRPQLCIPASLRFNPAFCLGLGLMFWRFAPESVWKMFLDVRSAVWGSFSLP